MLDVTDIQRASGLRWLKWASTLCGSVAIAIAVALAINRLSGPDEYPWYWLSLAVAVAVVSFAIRKLISLKLREAD